MQEEEEETLVTEPCCACEEAKYEVMFQGLWSKETHPRDFPTSEWLLHFSDVIGASHSADYRVWQKGGIASKGLEQVKIVDSETMLMTMMMVIKGQKRGYSASGKLK